MGKDNITLTEVEDMDVDMILKMFLVFPIHFLHYAFNKILLMFLWIHFLQSQTLTLLLLFLLQHM